MGLPPIEHPSLSWAYHVHATTPAGPREPVRSYRPLDFDLPRLTAGSAPALNFSRPAQRSLTLGPTSSRSHQCDPFHRKLQRLRYLHRRSDCYRVERTSSRGRDRAEARALVVKTKSRFLGPPCNPGRSDFPIPVLALAFPVRSFRDRWRLSARPHAP